MKSLKSTLLHSVELLIVLCIAFAIINFFNLGGQGVEIVMSVVLGAFIKFARTSEAVPVKDYVNKN